MFRRIRKYIKFLFSGANVLKTIQFNFRMLPWRDAIHLPIWLYGKMDISCSNGRIEWINGKRCSMGAWHIGQTSCYIHGQNVSFGVTRLAIQGTLKLGRYGFIYNNTRVSVLPGALLSLGYEFLLNEQSKICAYNHIEIGDNVHISWECQVYDTDFHYVMIGDGKVHRNTSNVYIGEHSWICHNSTISKGGSCGKGCILAAHSLLNKDFSDNEYSLIAGVPSQIKKKNVIRLYGNIEYILNEYFRSNPQAIDYKIANYENFIV